MASAVILADLLNEAYILVAMAAWSLLLAFEHMQEEVFSQIFCIAHAKALRKLPVFWIRANSFIKYILFTNVINLIRKAELENIFAFDSIL